jgi:hypothetical protein
MFTSLLSEINWLAVAVAAAAYFMLGALWYSVLFGKIWIKATGIDMSNPDAKKGAGGIMTFTFVLEFITCIGIGMIAYMLSFKGMEHGIKLGLLTGVCFSAIGISISYLYQSKPLSLHLIDAGYHIVGNVIAAAVICMWA